MSKLGSVGMFHGAWLRTPPISMMPEKQLSSIQRAKTSRSLNS
jgi:hypothetical protein